MSHYHDKYERGARIVTVRASTTVRRIVNMTALAVADANAPR